jgi:hypothetical protein
MTPLRLNSINIATAPAVTPNLAPRNTAIKLDGIGRRMSSPSRRVPTKKTYVELGFSIQVSPGSSPKAVNGINGTENMNRKKLSQYFHTNGLSLNF